MLQHGRTSPQQHGNPATICLRGGCYGTYYLTAAGQHSIKGGPQIDYLSNDVSEYEAGPSEQVYWTFVSLGFAYDVNGDGRWRAYGSCIIFYDIFKMNLGRGSFRGEKWIVVRVEHPGRPGRAQRGWPELPADLPSNLLGAKPYGPYDYGLPGSFDLAIKPMKSQEGDRPS